MKNNLTDRIAIIGGTGFIGSGIYQALRNLNSEVIYTSRRNLNHSYDKSCIKFDLLNKSSWDSLLSDFKPNIIICTAWETEHDKYWHKETNHDYMKSTIDHHKPTQYHSLISKGGDPDFQPQSFFL